MAFHPGRSRSRSLKMLAAAVCVVALSPGCPTGGGVAGAGSRPTTVTPTGAAPVGAPPNRESPWCVRPIVNGPSRTAVPIVTVNQFPGYHCTARRTLQVKPSRGSSGRSRAVGAADPIAVQGFGARNRLGATTTYGLRIVDRSIREPSTQPVAWPLTLTAGSRHALTKLDSCLPVTGHDVTTCCGHAAHDPPRRPGLSTSSESCCR